eukprot:28612_5
MSHARPSTSPSCHLTPKALLLSSPHLLTPTPSKPRRRCLRRPRRYTLYCSRSPCRETLYCSRGPIQRCCWSTLSSPAPNRIVRHLGYACLARSKICPLRARRPRCCGLRIAWCSPRRVRQSPHAPAPPRCPRPATPCARAHAVCPEERCGSGA